MKADLFSISIYWGALLISLLLCQMYQKSQPTKLFTKVIYIILISLPLAIVAGARYDVGTDYTTYSNFYQLHCNGSLKEVFSIRYEKGFLFFSYLCYQISSGSVFFYFFVVQLLILSLAISGFVQFSRLINLPVAFFLYYIFFYHPSLNIIRSSIAISFLIFSYRFLLEEKWIKYYATILIGYFFHSTMLLCTIYPLVFFFSGKFGDKDNYIKSTKNTSFYILFMILFVPLISTILQIMINSVYVDTYDDYIKSADAEISIGTIVVYILYALPIMLFNWEYIKKHKIYARLRDLTFLYIPISFVGYFASWASRLNRFSLVAFLFLFAIAINDSRIKKWTTKYSVLVCIIFYFVSIVINNNSETFPYKFLRF